MKKIDLRKEYKEEEVIEFEEFLCDYEWKKTDNSSNNWDIVKILPLGSAIYDYYLAQNNNYEQVRLYRCKK